MNTEEHIQALLKEQYLKGPKVKMNDEKIGINFYSGSDGCAYYELWGEEQIFKLIVLNPPGDLFLSRFVGKNHLMFLLIEADEKLVGGFAAINKDINQEFMRIFSHLDNKTVMELTKLWEEFAKEHFYENILNKKLKNEAL